MDIKKLRLQQAWSQEELSQCSGISVRTIQRLEKGGQMSLESRKSLAAAFDLDADDLTETDTQTASAAPPSVERQTLQEVRDLKRFYKALLRYGVTMALLLIINLIASPDYLWVIWPALGWGVFLLRKGLQAYAINTLLGSAWEKRQVKKRLAVKPPNAS